MIKTWNNNIEKPQWYVWKNPYLWTNLCKNQVNFTGQNKILEITLHRQMIDIKIKLCTTNNSTVMFESEYKFFFKSQLKNAFVLYLAF